MVIKQRAYYDREIQKKTAELSQAQKSVQETTNMPNPCNSKALPIKDVPDARKLLEFIFEIAVESSAASHLDMNKANKLSEKVKSLKYVFFSIVTNYNCYEGHTATKSRHKEFIFQKKKMCL